MNINILKGPYHSPVSYKVFDTMGELIQEFIDVAGPHLDPNTYYWPFFDLMVMTIETDLGEKTLRGDDIEAYVSDPTIAIEASKQATAVANQQLAKEKSPLMVRIYFDLMYGEFYFKIDHTNYTGEESDDLLNI